MIRMLFFLTVAVGAALAGSSAQAQTPAPAAPSGSAIEYHASERTLTVHLNGLPLRQAMEELSRQTQIRFRPPDSTQAFDSRPVTASFERMPIERAIKQLLGPSNTAMLYGPPPASGRGAKPVLAEVRVLDLGIIPITATASTAASGSNSLTGPSRLTPEQLQARRDATQQKRADKQNRGRGRSGGQSNTNTTGQKDAPGQPSGDTSKPAGGGQQPAGNAPAPGGNGNSGGGAKP